MRADEGWRGLAPKPGSMAVDPHREDEPALEPGHWRPVDAGLRARAEKWFKGLPVLGGATDPAAGLLLWLIAIVTGIAVALAGDVFFRHDKDARSHAIQLAGGVIILFGAYFTARQLMNAQTQKYAERLSSTLERLGNESMSVRLGAIRLLQGMLLESPGLPGDKRGQYIEAAWRAAIKDALRAFAEAGHPKHVNDPDRRLAKKIWPMIEIEHFADEWIYEEPESNSSTRRQDP